MGNGSWRGEGVHENKSLGNCRSCVHGREMHGDIPPQAMALVVGNQVVKTRESPAGDLRVTTTFLSLSSSHFSGVFVS